MSRFRLMSQSTFFLAVGAVLPSLTSWISPVAAGPTVYASPSIQYGVQDPIHYAGSDPRFLRDVDTISVPAAHYGRVNGFRFVDERLRTGHVVQRPIPRIYTDALPGFNAYLFGYSVDDVRNESNAAQPRYVRMRDVRRASGRLR